MIISKIPGLSDDAPAGVPHFDTSPEIDSVPLVVSKAVFDH